MTSSTFWCRASSLVCELTGLELQIAGSTSDAQQFVSSLFMGETPPHMHSVLAAWSRGELLLLVIRDRHRACLGLCFTNQSLGLCEVVAIEVRQDYRFMGLGTILLVVSKELLMAESCHVRNAALRPQYRCEATGFVQVGDACLRRLLAAVNTKAKWEHKVCDAGVRFRLALLEIRHDES